jgi:aryl-alcohol dehydrogenase-like predicted oxidoreductase
VTAMPTRRLGGLQVSAIGLGEMPLSLAGRPDEAQAIRTIHAALDAGVTLIDTADAYCLDGSEFGHGERLVAKALAAWPGDRDRVLVATKGGHTREGRAWGLDGRPEYLRRACEASLRALGVEAIGLHQFHRPDPKVPFAESVGAMAELKAAGKVRLVGLSNVSVDQISQARQLVDVASVQNEFSPRFRRSEGELAFCAAQRIAFLPWSPLGGIGRGRSLGQRHRAFGEVAGAHGVSPQQVALAWQLAKAPVVIPIPGSSRPETIIDSAAAANLRLSDDELARLDRV